MSARTTVQITMPQMGESVTEGTVLEWLKQVGDRVERDEGLLEVSTDKVDTEIPAPESGTLTSIEAGPDETVPVGAVLGTIETGGDGVPAATGNGGRLVSERSPDGQAETAPPDPGPATPAERDEPPAREDEIATPVARRIASAHDLDLSDVAGSGPRGRVTKEDVLAAIDGPRSSVADGTPSPSPEPRPLRGAAATAARFMNESRSLPTATSFRTIPVGVLDARRGELKSAGRRLSFTHLIAWAIVQAARDMPVMTSSYTEVQGKPSRVVPGEVSLGLAVDVERRDGTRSLIVPVLSGADRLAFADFAARYDELIAGARDGTLAPDAYQGASMTLTNPGGLGTVASVPRLMPGQGTIVATGAIAYPPGLAEAGPQALEQLGVSKVMTMTSTYDHRVIQGAESGSFLRRIDELLQGEDGFYEGLFAALELEAPANEGPAGAEQATATADEPAAARVRPDVAGAPEELLQAVQAATSVVKAHRMHGHLAAQLDPLGSKPIGDPALDPATVHLTQGQMAAIPAAVLRVAVPGETFADALPRLQETYCGTIAYEIEHISDHDHRVWLRQAIESGAFRPAFSAGRKRALLERLTEVELLETYLHRAFLGKKSFSIEGLDSLVPMLDETIEMASAEGAREVVLGMAHRGRLNVLAHTVGRSYEAILAEFEGEQNLDVQTAQPEEGTGDVKYHHGASGTYRTSAGKGITVTLAANPSHLEYVNPVVVGRARADQTSRRGRESHHDPSIVLPILIHGDASFPAGGVVAETLNLSGLEGYSTGGTVHIITNNQLGFTTLPEHGRSTRYASDLAKGFDIPIIHVNADDVEACISAAWLAFAYRDRFRRDALIDLIGYRRYGHNETDEPAYTQPGMYERIKAHAPVRKIYARKLIDKEVIGRDEAEEMAKAAHKRLAGAHDELKASIEEHDPETGEHEVDRSPSKEPRTAVSAEALRSLNNQLHKLPEGFTLHRKLGPQLDRRRKALEDGTVDWAHAETLAWASLLQQNVPIRLTGQDTERGTFSQRHLVLHDANSGRRHCPIQALPKAEAPFELHNSPLSEIGCLGFEYGYSAHAKEALVLWEAQFGDFVNAAQVIVDQFLVSGLSKWGIASRLTLLLPHGYEGSGPEHSSARIERFLSLASEGNLRIANPSTPAQYFHLLRRQALVKKRRPLIVMTPKSLLRHPAATSPIEELTEGSFHPVLDDPMLPGSREAVTRLVLCSGKVFYDITQNEQRPRQSQVAVGRVELLYPFAANELRAQMDRYPALETVAWAQEEPQNMGARAVMEARLRSILPDGVSYEYVGRPLRASPGEGYPPAHLAMQSHIVRSALGLSQPGEAEAEDSALQTTTKSGPGS